MNRIFFRKRRIPSSIILDSFIQNKWIEWLFDIGFCLSEDDSVPPFVEWNLCHWIISTDRDKSSGSRVRGQPITSNSLIRSTFRDHHLQSTIEWVPTRTRRVIWSIRSGNVSPDEFISSSNITDQQWLSFSIGLNRGDQKYSFHWIESSSLSLKFEKNFIRYWFILPTSISQVEDDQIRPCDFGGVWTTNTFVKCLPKEIVRTWHHKLAWTLKCNNH